MCSVLIHLGHISDKFGLLPVAQVGGLPHGPHQPVDRVGLPLAVHAHALLHRHGHHLLKQV